MDASDSLFWKRLIAWRVDAIFGLPAGGINGISESLRKRKDWLRELV